MSDFKAVKAGSLKEGEKGIRAGSRMRDPWLEDEEEALNELVVKAMAKLGHKTQYPRLLADVQKWAETELPTRSRLAIKIRLGSLFFGYTFKTTNDARRKLRKKESKIEELRKEVKRLKKAQKTKKATEDEKEEGELTDEYDE